MQSLPQLGIVEVGLPGVERGGFAIARDDGQLIVRQGGEVDGGADGIPVQQTRDLLRRQGEDVRNVPRLPVADLDAERRDQHERGDAVGAPHRHLRGDPSAERRADHDGVAGVLLGKKIEVEIGEIVDGVDGVRVGGMAIPRMRRGLHVAVRGEQIEHRRRRIEPVFPVEPEDGTPLPSLDHLELHAADYSKNRRARNVQSCGIIALSAQ